MRDGGVCGRESRRPRRPDINGSISGREGGALAAATASGSHYHRRQGCTAGGWPPACRTTAFARTPSSSRSPRRPGHPDSQPGRRSCGRGFGSRHCNLRAAHPLPLSAGAGRSGRESEAPALRPGRAPGETAPSEGALRGAGSRAPEVRTRGWRRVLPIGRPAPAGADWPGALTPACLAALSGGGCPPDGSGASWPAPRRGPRGCQAALPAQSCFVGPRGTGRGPGSEWKIS